MSYEKRQKLVKEIQVLSSWSWFYLNSENLLASRYPKASKLITNRSTGNIEKVTIIPYLDYSKRFKEDRDAAFKIGFRLRAAKEKLDEFDKLRDKRRNKQNN